MRIVFIISICLFFENVSAYSFDPALISVMDDATALLDEELAIAEPAFCKRLLRKSGGLKNKSYSNCQNYRSTLKNYQASIYNAKKKIRLLDGWMPTERLFVDRFENFVFLTQPSTSIPKMNKTLVNKLDLLYISIYQYPIIP
jgi:hypothetical protein